METNERKTKWGVTIVLCIICICVGAIVMYGLFYFFPTKLSSVTNINKLEKEVTVNENGISDAVEKIYDAVVVVETYNNGRGIASGTGFVYKLTGNGYAYILTNNHVIEDGNEIYVTFTDGKRVRTNIIGSDSYADIAVLSVSEDAIISVAELGSSVDAKVGDTVFATGAPLDSATYSWTVTRGIVSGKDRMVEVSTDSSNSADWIMKVLQTDAAINSGNSGGPLANSNGQVIGINSLKLASTGVEGMGFAIPIEDALAIAEKLEKGEKIVRPVLGISMYDVRNTAYVMHYGIEVPDDVNAGVVIASIERGSCAEKAGLKTDDIIVKMGDADITSVAMLRYQLYKYEVGDKVEVTYYRDGSKRTVTVTLTN